jgi:hypothetical protein
MGQPHNYYKMKYLITAVLTCLSFLAFGQTVITGSSSPISTLECKNEYINFPDGIRLFDGLLVTQGNKEYYLDKPYTVEVLGQVLVFNDADVWKDKIAVRLSNTVYANMADFTNAAKACGTASGSVSSVDVSTAGGNVTVTVNGISDSAPIGPSPHVDTTDPTAGDDQVDGYQQGQIWVNTVGDRIWIAETVSTGAAIWLRVDNIEINSTTANPTVNDDSGDGYEVGSYWVNTSSQSVFFAVDVTPGSAIWVDVSGGGILHNFTATTNPTANDDSGNGYEPSSFWYNTNNNQLFVNIDSSSTAAVWVRTDNVKLGLSSSDPGIGDDAADGYEIGSYWINTSTSSVFFAIDVTGGAAVWVEATPVLHNFTATTNPATGDDVADGYSSSSFWYNTLTDRLWVCVDNSLGAAIWNRVDNIQNEAITSDPTANDDANDGYEIGSHWLNTTTDKVFYCANSAVGAAEWIELNPDAVTSSGGKFTYTDANAIITATDTTVTVSQDNASGTATVTVPDGTDLYSLTFTGTTTETAGDDSYTVIINYGGTRNHDNDLTDMRPPFMWIWNTSAQDLGGPTSGLPFPMDSDNTPQRQIIDLGGGSSSITVKILSLSSTFPKWSLGVLIP